MCADDGGQPSARKEPLPWYGPLPSPSRGPGGPRESHLSPHPHPGLTASVCLCDGSLPTPHPPARSWSTLLTWDARAHFGSHHAVWLSELRPGASLGQEVGSREQASHCVHCEEPRASKGFYGVSSGTSSRERSCRHRRRGAALGEESYVRAHALTHTGARVAMRLAPRL